MARPTLRLSVRSLFDRSADLHVVPPTAAPLRFSKDYKSSFPCTLSRAAVNVQCDCSPGTFHYLALSNSKQTDGKTRRKACSNF